jgi:hypothetical protein
MGTNGNGLYTAEQFIKAIPGTGGIIGKIADRVGCDWHTAKKYIFKHPTITQAYTNEKERIKDTAETKLIEQIEDGQMWAIKYYLSTQGKDRGYVERQEVTGSDGGPIQFSEVVVELPNEG